MFARFWQETKRRNIPRSMAIYCGTAYIIFEAATLIFPRWGLPGWTIDILLYVLIVGAIINAIVAWMFDLSQDGVKKTKPLEQETDIKKPAASASWKIATYISIVVIIGLILFNILSPAWMSRYQRNLENSIAVLPFDNLSYDEAQLWFTVGISDVIISQLSKIAGLRVIQRNSTQRYREKTMSIADIGKELGVKFIVDGTVQKQGDHIRVVPKLIRVKNETHLWSEVYDSDWEGIFAIQTEIAKKVASNLHTVLSPEEVEKIENPGTEDPDAWEYYLKGNYLMRELTEMNVWKAIDKYKQAIDLDENFAQAYAGLAYAYFELTIYDVLEPDPSLIPVARKWAFKALELNENLGEPYYVLGMINYHHDWDWKAAEKALSTGMEQDPTVMWGRNYYANFLTFMRRFEESMAVSERSIELDPMVPSGYLELAFTLVISDLEKAEELLLKSLELHPDYLNARIGLAMTYVMNGENHQYAIDFCQELLEGFHNNLQIVPGGFLGVIGHMLAMAGGQVAVDEVLNELLRRLDTEEKDVSYLWLGEIYYVLGETETAMDYFEKGYEVQEPFFFRLNYQPQLESLRSEPRFQALLQNMGFES